ncbi:hypothetical protein BH09MYX1_BH09MYX1_32770 [soil metagenome]
MSRQRAGLVISAVLFLGLACGGQAGKPTADDSQLPKTAQCPLAMGCYSACLPNATSRDDVDICAGACPNESFGGGIAGDLYSCRGNGGKDCFAFLQDDLRACLDLYYGNVYLKTERIAAIPAALVGIWGGPTATLTIQADRHVLYDNWAVLDGCRVDEHLEGTASTQSDGTLVLDILVDASGLSYMKDCNGEKIERVQNGMVVWYAFRIDDTTAGVRLSLDAVHKIVTGPTTESFDTKVDGWGEDYYYRRSP